MVGSCALRRTSPANLTLDPTTSDHVSVILLPKHQLQSKGWPANGGSASDHGALLLDTRLGEPPALKALLRHRLANHQPQSKGQPADGGSACHQGALLPDMGRGEPPSLGPWLRPLGQTTNRNQRAGRPTAAPHPLPEHCSWTRGWVNPPPSKPCSVTPLPNHQPQ